MRADFYTGVALNTACMIPDHFPFSITGQRPGRTIIHTDAAVAAELNGFRIMAKPAVEGTPLEKD